MFSIIYSKDSLQDIQEIFDYISGDNPFQAKKVIEELYENIDSLKLFPFLGKEIKNDFREIVAKHQYRIIYKVIEKNIFIITIFKNKNIWK